MIRVARVLVDILNQNALLFSLAVHEEVFVFLHVGIDYRYEPPLVRHNIIKHLSWVGKMPLIPAEVPFRI